MDAVIVTKNLDEVKVIKNFPIPEPGADEVLIKNVFVASNPKDWKVPVFWGKSLVEGNDVAGYIEKVGSEVKEFKVGDRVAGFSKMMTDNKYGAYAEYTVVPAWTTFHVKETTPLEKAASLPLAGMTAALGLYRALGLPEPGQKPASDPGTLVVYGASSSVGVFATQLAKLSNLHVVGVAGASKDMALEAGCDKVVDYRGKSPSQLVDEIKQQVGSAKVHSVYDAISEKGSVQICADLLASYGGGIVTTVLPPPKDYTPPNGVTISQTMVGTAHTTDAKWASAMYSRFTEWVDAGKIGNRVKLVSGGLQGVASGLKALKAGEVSGVKLVYAVSNL